MRQPLVAGNWKMNLNMASAFACIFTLTIIGFLIFRGMEILEPGRDLESRLRAFQQVGNTVIYLQKIMDLPGRDLGLVFLGGEYVGAYARVAKGNSWNTTIHHGGRYAAAEPDNSNASSILKMIKNGRKKIKQG